jgi:hypothetical protein
MNFSADMQGSGFFEVFFNEELYKVKEQTYNLPNEETSPQLGTADAEMKEPVAKDPMIQTLAKEPQPAYKKGTPHSDKKDGTILLFSYPGKTFIPEKDRLLLDNILKSVNLSFENTEWLNVSTLAGGRTELLHKLDDVRQIVCFGIPRFFLPDGQAGETGTFDENGKKWLWNKSLSEIAQDKNLKALLWKGLKELFQLS